MQVKLCHRKNIRCIQVEKEPIRALRLQRYASRNSRPNPLSFTICINELQAGAHVYHAGRIGKDAVWVAELMKNHGVNTDLLAVDEAKVRKAASELHMNCVLGVDSRPTSPMVEPSSK